MRMTPSVLARAVDAGRIGDPNAARTLLGILTARRKTVAAYWMGRVTPLQLAGEDSEGVILRDEAAAWGFEGLGEYRIEYLDAAGNQLLPVHSAKPGGSCFWLGVPKRRYLVMRIWREGRTRPAEVHTVNGRVVGVRH